MAQGADDSAHLQQLYEVTSARYGQQVECRLGTLKGGRRFAQVMITDSAALHSPPETQREAAKAVALYVQDQLKNEPGLETIRIGWKYSPAGGFSSAVTYDFVRADLEPDRSGREPS